jgi:hypothetical protein
LITVVRLAGFTPIKLAVGKGLHVVYRLELRYSTSGMRLSGSGWEDFTVSNAKLLCISLTPPIWRAGFPEDAATGVAAAALGAYLTRCDLSCRPGIHEFLIAQGYAMGAPSVTEAIVDCADGQITRTAIRGMAHILRDERVAV